MLGLLVPALFRFRLRQRRGGLAIADDRTCVRAGDEDRVVGRFRRARGSLLRGELADRLLVATQVRSLRA
jgi:hypothetical protein